VQIGGKKYASYRVLVRFNSTNSTAVKDTIFYGVSTPATTNDCVGGYDKSCTPTWPIFSRISRSHRTVSH
jgi:hypothetical protein